jgi:hypothetical protein
MVHSEDASTTAESAAASEEESCEEKTIDHIQFVIV